MLLNFIKITIKYSHKVFKNRNNKYMNKKPRHQNQKTTLKNTFINIKSCLKSNTTYIYLCDIYAGEVNTITEPSSMFLVHEGAWPASKS